jgi:hypothetical protein
MFSSFLEEAARVGGQHGGDLLLGHPVLAGVRQDLVVDMQVVSLRQERQDVRVDPVDVARQVLG